MSRRADQPRAPRLVPIAVTVLAASLLGCGGPETRDLQVGVHRVRLVPLQGWEHLDHGRQHLFRRDEMQISLTDLGPGTQDGMRRELDRARELWLSGRSEDAFQRVRQLSGPALFLASPALRAEFWNPWNNLFVVRSPDSTSVSAAFDSLEARVAGLPVDSLETMAGYALQRVTDASRVEVRRITRQQVHGRTWIVVETWSPLTHENLSRMACVDDEGYLLALNQDRGPAEVAGIAFLALLPTIELPPPRD